MRLAHPAWTRRRVSLYVVPPKTAPTKYLAKFAENMFIPLYSTMQNRGEKQAMACRRNAPLLPLLQLASLPRMPVTLEESRAEHLPPHLLHKPKASRNDNLGLKKSSPHMYSCENHPKRQGAVYLRLCRETAVKLWWKETHTAEDICSIVAPAPACFSAPNAGYAGGV